MKKVKIVREGSYEKAWKYAENGFKTLCLTSLIDYGKPSIGKFIIELLVIGSQDKRFFLTEPYKNKEFIEVISKILQKNKNREAKVK